VGTRLAGRRRTISVVAGTVVLATTLAACGTSSTPSSPSDAPPAASSYRVGTVGPQQDAGTPVDGGRLTFGAYSEAGVLDPAKTIAAGTTGGIEMAAVYDVLMRWDAASDTVVPQLAESLTASADHRTWTLTLRPGVTFSDGSPLDSGAVRSSIDRYVTRKGDEASLWSRNVTGLATPDPRTVVFSLGAAWPTFDFLLTTGPGMIVGRGSDAAGGFTPIGAGPFTLQSYRPKEETILAARKDYWGGAPHLDSVRVVYVADPVASYESFTQGSTTMSLTRDPQVVSEAMAANTSGYLNPVSLGNVAVINSAPGRPGADPRVRQAMQLALDVDAIDQRAFKGSGLASSAIFPPFSQWHNDVAPLGHDADRARELLSQARADGYNGTVKYLTYASQARQDIALSVKAMLESVGFTVETEVLPTVGQQISRVAVNKDYDVAGWGMSWREAGPYGRMFATLHSQGNATVGVATSPEMDALIEQFQTAGTKDAQREVMGRIQQQWNTQVPALVYGAVPEMVMWSSTVHGPLGTSNSMVLLDKAWVSR
jgi:peptide/nickel transport system substrate-binding protein